MGKVPVGVAKLAQKQNRKVIALAGSITDDAFKLHDLGVTAMFSIIDAPMSLEEAMDSDNAKRMVRKKVIEVFQLLL